MAWRTPTIVLTREAVAQHVNPDLWSTLSLHARRRIAAFIAEDNGDQALAMALVQGNPNLTDIQMQTDYPLPA